MNDFTKEELQIIWNESSPCVSQEMRPILEKIQSMIDNYCEHEFQIKSLNPHFLMMCDKCCKTFVDVEFTG